MPNYALLVQYEGSAFHGWQKQQSQKTVQGSLEKALAILFKNQKSPHLSVAGRTDTGVHALGMVCNFKAENEIFDFRKFITSMNALGGDGLAIKSVVTVPEEFHSRFSCQSREYLYRIYYSKTPNPLEIGRSYWMKYQVDWEMVQKELPSLLGEKDFRSLAKAFSVRDKRTFREIQSISLEKNPGSPEIWEFRIRANGFMHNMVRITLGTLLDIGKGRWEGRSIESILQEKDRTEAGITLPPYGLYFIKAHYPEFPQIQTLYEASVI